MPPVIEPHPEALTFDCYGTLIDWERGIADALGPVLAGRGIAISKEELLELYGELESEIERGQYLPYREVLRQVVDGFGQSLGFDPSEEELDSLAASIGEWPPFPDTGAALERLARSFSLGVISNVDDELFARTARHFSVEFDWVVTAEQVGAYKPSHQNFEEALRRIGLPRERVLHVAQSLFHDVAPARELGIRCVWVNRRAGKPGAGATTPSDAQPDYEVSDLATAADLLRT